MGKFWKKKFKSLKKVGAIAAPIVGTVAAPFTGGASIALGAAAGKMLSGSKKARRAGLQQLGGELGISESNSFLGGLSGIFGHDDDHPGGALAGMLSRHENHPTGMHQKHRKKVAGAGAQRQQLAQQGTAGGLGGSFGLILLVLVVLWAVKG